MRHFITCCLVLCLTASNLTAQRADSAAAARRLMRGATAALAKGDTLAAADSVLAAARSWPTQPAYWLATARWQGLAGRPAVALEALATLSALGGGWQPDDPRLAPLARQPGFAALRRPEVSSRSARVATLPDPDFHPEGVAWDPRTRRLFVGSVHRGSVVVIGDDGVVTSFVPAGSSGLRAVFGVLADTARNLLWVSSGDVPEREGGVATPRTPSAVFAFSLADGRLVRRWSFPGGDPAHLIGELVLAPDGTVWGTDSEQPALYRVPSDSSRTVLERVALSHPDWQSLQGLAFSEDGRQAWVADWTTGLFHLDLQVGVVTPVATPPGTTLLGIDGLYRVGAGHFLAIQNGITPHRLAALDLDTRGTRLRALRPLDHPPGGGEPTLGVVTESGLLFVSGSLWPFYDGAGQLSPRAGRPMGEIRRIPWR